jgi:hypothetical protein
MYWGITAQGQVFATTTAPASWASTTSVYIQERTSGSLQTLGNIW